MGWTPTSSTERRSIPSTTEIRRFAMATFARRAERV